MQHFNGSYRDNTPYDAWQYHMVQLENIIDDLRGDEPCNRSHIASSFKENGICYTDEDYEYVAKYSK